jgi:hypothetical protein
MHSTTLRYKGYAIIVEDYIYMLEINRTQRYLTMQDIMNRIDELERVKKLKPEPNAKTKSE